MNQGSFVTGEILIGDLVNGAVHLAVNVQYTGFARKRDVPARITMTIFARLSLLIATQLLTAALACAGPDTGNDPASPDPSVEDAAQTDQADACDQEPSSDHLPEKMQAGVHEFSCRTLRWVDSWFGDTEDFREEDVYGKLKLSMSWNEFDDLESRMRYRVKTDLPNFSSRWDAFVGRVDEEAFVSDTETVEDRQFRQGIVDRDDPEWLLGLGYRDRARSGEGWDYSVGFRLRTPPRFYVKARYRKRFEPSDDLSVRMQQTLFWRDGIGYGTTSHLDTAYEMATGDLLRWELLATISEDTEGTRWWAGNTWYHRQTDKHGISLLSFVRGETGKAVPLQEYGFELTWRRRVAREWLFFNFGPTLTWPREELHQKREASLGFAVSMDFEFGERSR